MKSANKKGINNRAYIITITEINTRGIIKINADPTLKIFLTIISAVLVVICFGLYNYKLSMFLKFLQHKNYFLFIFFQFMYYAIMKHYFLKL